MKTSPSKNGFFNRAFNWATAGLLAATLLGGCSAMTAQNPSGTLKPVNAVADGADTRVMLKGADVVSYFTAGKDAVGSPQIKSVYQDVTFRFATAANKALFDANPAKYQPQYGGYCANGLSTEFLGAATPTLG